MSRTLVNDLLKIFKSSVHSVLPENLIRNSLKFNTANQELIILGDSYTIHNRNVYLIGTGKAVQSMAREVEVILDSKIKSGIISIPFESFNNNYLSNNVYYYEGAKNNLPDTAAEATAKKVKDFVQKLIRNDLLIVLISGGGSALLPLPKEPITLEEKTDVIKKLANCGADIKELNTVRKKLSDLKGGQLAQKAQPATVVSLILSDIVGDPLDLIASGPTVENEDESAKAINIVKKFNLYDNIPDTIKTVLNQDINVEKFPKDNVKNYIIGSNKISINAAAAECRKLEYLPLVLSNIITGHIKTIAEEYAKLATLFCKFLNMEYNIEFLKNKINNLHIPGLDTSCLEELTDVDTYRNICLILGGEITVEVKGTGKGGRNQQLALEFSKCVHHSSASTKNFDIYFLSAGTDGIDGPTNAAGAIGYSNLIEDSIKENLDVNIFIQNNDSYNFYNQFKNGVFHLITGHTNTNVMDIHLLIIRKK
ncbi:hypothetical protein K1T71_013595 [Dendrolimus kikuchii]|uniref:Uncharacterized protein n=1 Tax=Dendrolimus kikuchii TaxID=765133 RepID=A0ACC1CGV9_9NEOP|nr:hypothetical protein K1T71_013595 [Dendrolimus kikuchii]